MFLTQQEIEQLTGRKRPSHQVRVLKKQGIPFQLRPQGATLWPVVLRVAVEGDLKETLKKAQPEPELKFRT